MTKSMTGYGRSEQFIGERKIAFEIRSVNHRYIDLNFRIPRAYSFLEEYIRAVIPNYVLRGKVDIFVNIENFGETSKTVRIDDGLAKGYVDAVRYLSESYGLEYDLKSTALAKMTDVLTVEKNPEDKQEVWDAVQPVLEEACRDFVAMRQREGERIAKNLLQRKEYLLTLVEKIEEQMPKILENYKQRLQTKVRDLLENNTVDENRLMTEVAIFADKVATDEEIVRLKSHFVEFETILNADSASGRKLDFLIQEMNREINTIGSKANDLEVTKLVVEVKSEIEKLREQIQNIE